jgi:hypothetical protein
MREFSSGFGILAARVNKTHQTRCAKKLSRSVAHALLFYFVAPPDLGRAEKWQFWTIAAANTNLYGGFPLLLNSTHTR